jgi:hypothetical protein
MEDINNDLIALCRIYPDAKIYTLTHAEVVCDDCGYWMGQIEKVYYGKFWITEESLFLRESDYLEYIKDHEYGATEFEGIIILINN